ncbi:hypothetical protein EV356DRAFT_152127 [Viridothelium virens]|uniref:Uncharacterized protein n=1 Tax=Viridothelium virens TaxID=1048519 RepID=A0A6A6H8N2_VIRVR|nr:hypothetical protein EV356DRAFT_152127 [Viridothelium virens]
MPHYSQLPRTRPLIHFILLSVLACGIHRALLRDDSGACAQSSVSSETSRSPSPTSHFQLSSRAASSVDDIDCRIVIKQPKLSPFSVLHSANVPKHSQTITKHIFVGVKEGDE